ncbi:MAG: fused response regulator/phosphatase [Candidatus Brocadiae bacterium]|nr:fused response regulator/phosphatase [Candidatus Brocadiia bacterium]
MEPFEKKSLDFLVELTRIIRNMQMYNDQHPIVKAGVQNAYRLLNDVLRLQPTLTFGKGEGVLLIQNKQITEKNAAADRFVQMLTERNISGAVMKQGAPVSELEAFIKLMSMKADTVVVDGQIKPELLKPFNKIAVNEVKYLMVGEDEDLESLTEARKFFNNIFSEEFKGLKGPEALAKIGQIIQKVLPKLSDMNFDNSQEELWEFFEKSVSSFGGSTIKDTRQSLLTSVKTMPPDVQKTLFGQVIRSPQQLEAVMKRFSDERKASILVEEANTGKEISGALESLLKNKGDIVKLVEALMKKFGGDDKNAGDFDRIFKMIQEIEAGDRLVVSKRGDVIIAETDEEMISQYKEVLLKLNFKVEIVSNGKELLSKLRKEETRPNLVVMDVKLPEMSGLEVLSALDMERIRIPVIIGTTMVSVQNSFEVQMYYKQKFFAKPVNIKDFLDAVEEFCPKPEEEKLPEETKGKAGHAEPELSEEMKAELSKAKEIQRNLMPRQFPPTPGFELYAFYKPYDQIGGDYYDVIPIDADHVGILIADVSGHGISGAMVMVMVRSAIRAWVNTTTSPKELLMKVNPIIARDILPGLFVTMYYAVLNLQTRVLTCSCAGHNPAVLWTTKDRVSIFTQKGGMPMGILAGPAFQATLKEQVIQLDKGDRVVLYTDGMVETMNPEGEEFSEESFCKCINEMSTQRSDIFVKNLVQAVTTFQSTAPQHDDLTLVTVRCMK